MQTLEKLFFLGYDLSQGADLYISFGFCLIARDSKLCIDFCTESAGNPFITLSIPLTEKQAEEIENGLQDTPAFIRSNFNEGQINEILTKGYSFAQELKIDLEREYRKQKLTELICATFPDIRMQEEEEEDFLEDYANDEIAPPYPFFAYYSESDKKTYPFLIIPDYEKEGNTAFRLNLETGKFSLTYFSGFNTLYLESREGETISDFFPDAETLFNDLRKGAYYYEATINEEDFKNSLPYFSFYVKNYV